MSLVVQQSVHVVVARYSEDLTWLLDWQKDVAKYPFISIFVYNKGKENDATARHFRQYFKNWVQLPNVGREGQTYLHHLCTYYNDLPETIVFLQGRIDDHTRLGVYHYIKKAQLEGISYTDIHVLSSDWKGRIAHKEKYLQAIRRGTMLPAPWTMKECWHLLFPEKEAPSILPVFWSGLFGVSRKRVLVHPRKLYELMNSWLGQSSDPEAGHYVERLWYTLFASSNDYVVVMPGAGYPSTSTPVQSSPTTNQAVTANSAVGTGPCVTPSRLQVNTYNTSTGTITFAWLTNTNVYNGNSYALAFTIGAQFLVSGVVKDTAQVYPVPSGSPSACTYTMTVPGAGSNNIGFTLNQFCILATNYTSVDSYAVGPAINTVYAAQNANAPTVSITINQPGLKLTIQQSPNTNSLSAIIYYTLSGGVQTQADTLNISNTGGTASTYQFASGTLTPGQVYSFQVAQTSGGVLSPTGTTTSVTINPDVPTSVSAFTNINTTGGYFSWTAPSTAISSTYYNVYTSNSSGTTKGTLVNASDGNIYQTNYTISSLTPNSLYYIGVVSAQNPGVESTLAFAINNGQILQTLSNPPTTLIVTMSSQLQANVTFPASPDANAPQGGYNIFYGLKNESGVFPNNCIRLYGSPQPYSTFSGTTVFSNTTNPAISCYACVTYTWYVCAYATTTSPASAPQQINVDNAGPPNSGTLASTSTSTTSVALKHTLNTSAFPVTQVVFSYALASSPNSLISSNTVTNNQGTGYCLQTWNNLTPSTAYIFYGICQYVGTSDTTHGSGYTGQTYSAARVSLSVTTLGPTPVTFTAGSFKGSFSVTWSPGAATSGYTISSYLCTAHFSQGGKTFSQTITANGASSYTQSFTQIAAGTAYATVQLTDSDSLTATTTSSTYTYSTS